MTAFGDMYSLAAVPLLEHQHGEPLAYTPHGGVARTVTGLVSHAQEVVEGKPVDYENEVIWVDVSRDSAAGIDEPQRGETLVRSGDPNETPFGYSGRIVKGVGETRWVLEFKRPKATIIGGKKTTTVLGR